MNTRISNLFWGVLIIMMSFPGLAYGEIVYDGGSRVQWNLRFHGISRKMASVLSQDFDVAKEAMQRIYPLLSQKNDADKAIVKRVEGFYEEVFGTKVEDDVADKGFLNQQNYTLEENEELQEAPDEFEGALDNYLQQKQTVEAVYEQWNAMLLESTKQDIAFKSVELNEEWERLKLCIEELNAQLKERGLTGTVTLDSYLLNRISAALPQNIN